MLEYQKHINMRATAMKKNLFYIIMLIILYSSFTTNAKAYDSNNKQNVFVDWWLDPYVGFGISPKSNNSNFAIGWRFYRLTPVVPAIEFERNKVYFQDDLGRSYNHMDNINLYLSFYGGINAINNMRMNGFNLYTKLGFGKNKSGNIQDVAIGGGIAWLDMAQIGYQHTTYHINSHNSTTKRTDNAFTFRVNVPLAIPTVGPVYILMSALGGIIAFH